MWSTYTGVSAAWVALGDLQQAPMATAQRISGTTTPGRSARAGRKRDGIPWHSPFTQVVKGALYRVLGRLELPLGRHRARCLTVRLPMPPVRPVRETFASYGSRERDICGKLPFRQLHGTFTVVSLRVRWLPLYRFPTLSLRAFAMCAVFPHSDYYALFDCLEGLGVSSGSSQSYSPSSFTSLSGSPVFDM